MILFSSSPRRRSPFAASSSPQKRENGQAERKEKRSRKTGRRRAPARFCSESGKLTKTPSVSLREPPPSRGRLTGTPSAACRTGNAAHWMRQEIFDAARLKTRGGSRPTKGNGAGEGSLLREANRTPSAESRSNRKTPGPYRAFFGPREDLNTLPRAKEKSRASVPPGFWGRSFCVRALSAPCPFKKSFAYFSSEK